jgi:UDP:flavonoid glycosyltransferase YjiC (YdhE family)
MIFALAAHGTRGDVERCAAVGVDLLRRGHEVRMAVPPNLVRFVESAVLAAVAYGPDSEEELGEDFFCKFWKIQNPVRLIRAGTEYITRGWAEMSRPLRSLAHGADLVLTGMIYQEVAANVGEY